MKRKTYKATIVNSGHTSIMLVGGYNKPSVKRELTDFFIKTKQIIDYKKFDIYLRQVIYINGDYIEVE